MKNRLIRICALLALTSLVALAADIDGTWMSKQQGPQTLTLKADGDKLTGTMVEGGRGGFEISEGTVYGNDVMFKVVRERNGSSVTQEFKGTVSGSDLKLSVGGGRKGPVEVRFKKQ